MLCTSLSLATHQPRRLPNPYSRSYRFAHHTAPPHATLQHPRPPHLSTRIITTRELKNIPDGPKPHIYVLPETLIDFSHADCSALLLNFRLRTGNDLESLLPRRNSRSAHVYNLLNYKLPHPFPVAVLAKRNTLGAWLSPCDLCHNIGYSQVRAIIDTNLPCLPDSR